MIRSGDGTDHFLHRKKGGTQGDPLAMISYGLGILPLLRDLRTAHPSITQLWFTDDTRAGSTFVGIRKYLYDLMV